MILRFRIVFLIAALVLLCLSLLALLNVLELHWGVESALAMGVPSGIAFLGTWVILEALHTWSTVRSPVLRCPHCDHSLRGLKCPECGERIDSAGHAE